MCIETDDERSSLNESNSHVSSFTNLFSTSETSNLIRANLRFRSLNRSKSYHFQNAIGRFSGTAQVVSPNFEFALLARQFFFVARSVDRSDSLPTEELQSEKPLEILPRQKA